MLLALILSNTAGEFQPAKQPEAFINEKGKGKHNITMKEQKAKKNTSTTQVSFDMKKGNSTTCTTTSLNIIYIACTISQIHYTRLLIFFLSLVMISSFY